MDQKSTLFSWKRFLIVAILTLLGTTGVFSQNFFYFHDYTGDRLWSNPDNWFEGLKPTDENAEVGIHASVIVDEDVDIQRIWDFETCDLTIQSGKKMSVNGSFSWSAGGEIILEDSAQLLHQEYYLGAKVLKKIAAYDADHNLWNLIASPVLNDVMPSTGNGFLTEPESGYSLYAFNEDGQEWIDFKETPFALLNEHSYLYANALDTTLVFEGNVRSAAAPAEIRLSYHASTNNQAGCNLVGNPFPFNAFADRSYYVLNENSNSLMAVALSSHAPIAPCAGIIVKAEEEGETITFNSEVPVSTVNQGYIEITAAKSDAAHLVLDQALLSFNAGDDLGKLALYEDAPRVYFTKENHDLAIMSIDSSDMIPLRFKAEKNGNYTLHFELKQLTLNYLHLIDNMTGTEIDLLASPNYTFSATTNDYASRFKLVFDPHHGIEEGYSETFAYFSDGCIVINDVETCQGASLQLVDLTGRVIVRRDGVHTVSTIGMTPGVYVLRLITSNSVRTQKIMIQ